MAAEILDPCPEDVLVAADSEHYSAELIDHVHRQTRFDIIMPIASLPRIQKRLQALPPECFTPHWAGYATAVLPYTLQRSRGGRYYELVQREGERPDQWRFKAFFSTTDSKSKRSSPPTAPALVVGESGSEPKRDDIPCATCPVYLGR